MKPEISVVFPVGNRQAFLGEAIESILGQTFGDFELLMVLDGVSDDVNSIVDSYRDERIRTVKLPVNQGVCAARNIILQMAQAPYLALMDSDDIAFPERFSRQHSYMESNAHVTACGSNFIKILSNGNQKSIQYPESDGVIKARFIVVDSAILNPTVMMRTDFVKKSRLLYDSNLRRDQDHMFYVEMLRKGAIFHNLQEELLLCRRHDTNVTCDMTGFDEEKTRVRERLFPVFFPRLSSQELQLLAFGMCQKSKMNPHQVCSFVAALHKAMAEQQVFAGEDRQEIRKILSAYLQKAMFYLENVAFQKQQKQEAGERAVKS